MPDAADDGLVTVIKFAAGRRGQPRGQAFIQAFILNDFNRAGPRTAVLPDDGRGSTVVWVW